MSRTLLLWPLMLLVLQSAFAQEAKMDPRIAYAPDIVGVNRLFMIAIKAPPGAAQIAVTVPPEVKLLDQTKLPTAADVRRYYFRSQKPGQDLRIVFAHPDGPLTVTLTVWSLDDLRAFRKLKDIQLPRRWPLGEALPSLKEGQTLTTQAQKDAARKSGGGAEGWLAMSDDDIWNMQPDSTIPRWHWVNVQFGCPTHGQEIYKTRAYYPWLKDGSYPYKWKIECPVGHELYPSNDFGRDDFTSGPFPDDGIGGGYVAPDGKHYGFIAELCQLYCHRMLSVAPPCAQAYLATGDIRYVHKALVALSRLAVEYAYLATMTQHRHRNRAAQVERFGQGRFDEGPILGPTGLTVYSIDQPSYQVSHAEAYDKIFDAIDQDPEIVPFLQKKGIAVQTGEDVRRFIEENLMATWMQAAMDGATNSNEPFHQWGLAKMAEMLNYPRGNEFFDWLYDGGGRMRIFVPNDYFRDGAPFESTGGYNGMHVVALGPIIDSIEHLKQLRPTVYPDDKYPSLSKSLRYRNVFDFCMDTVIIDRTFPLIGDSGSWPKYEKLAEITYHDASDAAFEHAYRLFKAPKFAWALTHNKRPWKPSLDFPYTREEVEKEAAKWPDDWNDVSSLHDGYGIAILRDGKGEDKRALWMMYGRARGHVQDNIMDIGLAAHQGVILQHMGYPRNWGYWEHSWSSHNVARQFPYLNLTAQAQFLADAGVAQVCEARARAHTEYNNDGTKAEEPTDYWQRRTLALVNVSPDQFYCVDLYRISGGQDHWWAFHCQEGDFSTEGLQLTKQQGGTLAGPDVPYGDPKWLKEHGCSFGGYGWSGLNFVFPHLYNVEKAKSDGGWSAHWKLKTGEGLQFRLHAVSCPGMEVNVTDGTSPAGGKPYEMKWLMLHRQAPETALSQVFTLMETYLNTPVVHGVEKLEVTGLDDPGFAPAGCIVKLADRTDYIVASADGSVARTAGPYLKFAGRFGLYAERDGRPVAISLVGGTEISKGQYGIKIDRPEFRGKIVRVDRQRQAIVVSPAPPVVETIVGQYVFLTNDQRRIASKVLAAKAVPQGVELTLNMDSRIGTGQASGAADFKVLTGTPFTLHYYDYYEGARVVNARGDAEYCINEVRSASAVMIDRKVHPEATAAKLAEQFPPGSWFEVYDYGVGDEVVWPYAVSVKLTGPGIYQVKSPVPVVLNLPK